jgi:hypothetical protein
MTATTQDPARGTGVPTANGLPAGGSPAPRGLLEGILSPAGLACLAAALTDAIAQREPSGFCIDCESDGSLCADHAGDLDLASDYAALARELGIELEET